MDRGPRGGGGGMMLGGLGTLLVAGLVLLMGGNLGDVLRVVGGSLGGGGGTQMEAPASPQQQQMEEFASVVLRDTEEIWSEIFTASGLQYENPRMTLYSGSTRLQSGQSVDSRMGPFYLPAEKRIYLDVNFFTELEQRHGAAGDFAPAYVIAHEVAHHVQNLLGRSEQILRGQQRDPSKANQLSVRLELNADYLAGVWANHLNAKHTQRGEPIIEEGDIDEAIAAAKAIGDDVLQSKFQGQVIPSNFTHGTAAQRMRWFHAGFESGDPAQGDQLFQLPYSQL